MLNWRKMFGRVLRALYKQIFSIGAEPNANKRLDYGWQRGTLSKVFFGIAPFFLYEFLSYLMTIRVLFRTRLRQKYM